MHSTKGARSHEALQIRIDRAIVSGDRIEARLRAPPGLRGLAGEQRLLERLLDRIKNLRLRFRQVAGEIAQERSLAETPFIAVEDDAGGGRRRREGLGQRRVVLACIRRPRRHIDKGRDIGMHTRLGDDHPGEGMPDQNRRAILPRQHALGRGDRFRQRRQWVLHGRGIKPRRLQARDHLRPA